jgi:hypothetical protein
MFQWKARLAVAATLVISAGGGGWFTSAFDWLHWSW